MILTVDFGTSVTKVAIWDHDGLVAMARADLVTAHPHPGWAEQDPFAWWTSVVVGCAEARAADPAAFAAVEVVACSAARQSFVPLTAAGEPLGKGILWSDRRAAAEAAGLARRLGAEGPAPHRGHPRRGSGGRQGGLAGDPPVRAPGRLRLAARPSRPGVVAAHGRGGDRRDRGLAHRPLRRRRAGGPRAGRPGGRQAGAGGRGRPGDRLAASRAGGRTGPAAGHPGGDRRRGSSVRGHRHRRRPAATHGELGHHGQRVGPGGEPPRPGPRGDGGLPVGRRRLAGRGRPVGGRLLPGLAGRGGRGTSPPSWQPWPPGSPPGPAG